MSLIRRKILLTIPLALAVFGLSCGGSGNGSDPKEDPADSGPVAVDTAVARVESIPTYFEATGSLASDAESNVAPTIGGKIQKVHFDVGSYVKKGQILVTLDPRDARIRRDQAKALLEQRKEAVIQAEASVDRAIANLRQTQVRLGVGDGKVFRIEDFSQVISVSAQLRLAEKELERYTKLLETGDVSHSAYDQKKTQRDSLIGQLAEARSNAAVAIKAINTARTGVNVAKAQVGGAKAAVTAARAQLAQAEKAVSDNFIYAPISGYVSERNADPGEFISPNQPNAKLATIVRTSVLRLRIDVPEQSIGLVRNGQSVSAQVSAYPGRNFAGRIVRSLPGVDPRSRTLTVEAEIGNRAGLLKPGQFATVRITRSKPAVAVLIPAKAVVSEGESNVVFVIKDGIADQRLVQVGLVENDRIEIKQGIRENELVAVSNLEKLGDGVIVAQKVVEKE